MRLILALATQYGWRVYHLNVKSSFLNGILQEEIFVNQPDRFVIAREEDKWYKLHKALFELNQTPKVWYSRVGGYFIENGFIRSIN